MAVCEFCWQEATRRALSRGAAVADLYIEVLKEAEGSREGGVIRAPWHLKQTRAEPAR